MRVLPGRVSNASDAKGLPTYGVCVLGGGLVLYRKGFLRIHRGRADG